MVKMKNKRRACLYMRSAVADDASIEAQREAITHYAKYENYEVLEEYVDNGCSGSAEDRPAYKQMINDIKSKKFNYIVVHRLDKLFRNMQKMIELYGFAQDANVFIVSATEPIDTSTPIGSFIFTMMLSMAELERQNMSERIKQWKLRKKEMQRDYRR